MMRMSMTQKCLTDSWSDLFNHIFQMPQGELEVKRGEDFFFIEMSKRKAGSLRLSYEDDI